MDRPLPSAATSAFASAECQDADHPQRAATEAFIAAVYRRRFAAELRSFMPHLLAFRSPQGELCAAVGLRCGSEGPLFVEHYLDQPAEQRIASNRCLPVSRRQIVELGSFAATTPGAARALILTVIPLLHDAGMRWVMWVATRQLRNAFDRLGLATRSLGPAQAHRLGEAAADWGHYYDALPELLYGDLHSVSLPQPVRAIEAAPAIVAAPCLALP